MANRIFSGFFILFFWQVIIVPIKAEIYLPKLFGDDMVLQRDTPIKFWGWSTGEDQISVKFRDKIFQTKPDKTGKWEVILPKTDAGGPYNIDVEGHHALHLKNILFGDVWICSGQSNMEWKIGQTPYLEEDTYFVNRNLIRLFTVHIGMDYLPKEDVKGGQWSNLNENNIKHFSAVAYHFGKTLNHELNIPIGLISCNLGATSIETWMSNDVLLKFSQFYPEIKPVVTLGKHFTEIDRDFELEKSDWEKEAYLSGKGMDEQWYLPETKTDAWLEMEGPGFWEDHGLPDHDGAVWFRRSFDLPENYEQDSFSIALGQIDDYDITWINGLKIGETFGRHNHRHYKVATHKLKPTGNTIVVRIFDVGGNGGFGTNAFWSSSLVRGIWKMKAGSKISAHNFRTLPSVNVTPFSSPGVLYNGNIAPLTRLSVKGVIWYQGEANAGRAEEYQTLFPAMIRDWRQKWHQPDLPFLFVQLANYQPENEYPGSSDWAELREAQAMALSLSNTGMAVTIDIGEANDIHPRNKKDVGHRLAMAALKIAYDREDVARSPRLNSVTFSEDKAIISFDPVNGALITKDKYGYIGGFALAGADQTFYWAKAKLVENKVMVYSENVPKPVAVRYAWSNNPGKIDLYCIDGLPVAPFRTDQWPGITHGKKFDGSKARF